MTLWKANVGPLPPPFTITITTTLRSIHRYAPLMTPEFLNFPVVGISLLAHQTYLCDSRTCTISLEQLGSRTTGTYRCEVSGDAPEFKLDSQTANMTIAGESNPWGMTDQMVTMYHNKRRNLPDPNHCCCIWLFDSLWCTRDSAVSSMIRTQDYMAAQRDRGDNKRIESGIGMLALLTWSVVHLSLWLLTEFISSPVPPLVTSHPPPPWLCLPFSINPRSI